MATIGTFRLDPDGSCTDSQALFPEIVAEEQRRANIGAAFQRWAERKVRIVLPDPYDYGRIDHDLLRDEAERAFARASTYKDAKAAFVSALERHVRSTIAPLGPDA
jgi:hypothetical protein